MAIRFDKDAKRATNGPMIFFSDPSAEISLCDEIRGAIESRLSFYAYRSPGDLMITYGSSESVVEGGIGIPGFVIAPFDPTASYLTIPYKPTSQKEGKKNIVYTFPENSTSREEHEKEVEQIKKALERIGNGKIVATRILVERGIVDAGATFAELCHKHPSAFVFCFSTPATGCWIGASPELLLESCSNGVSTMALAGSRPTGSSGDWDLKNMKEQEMVTTFIKDTLDKNGFSVTVCDQETRRAGKVEHICTPITAYPEFKMTPDNLSAVLRDLSPTPALCGMPRDLALKIISENENFNRAFYGGFCGPYRSASDFSFHVTLRCCQIEANRYCIYAGGGITRLSSPDAEWNETEIKSTTMRDCLRME